MQNNKNGEYISKEQNDAIGKEVPTERYQPKPVGRQKSRETIIDTKKFIAKADIGKWHLKQPAPAYNLMSPQALGYDWFEGPFIGQLPSYTNWTKYTNGAASTITTYATTENVNNAVAWVKTVNANKPFFLWLAFNAPHEPLHLPPPGLHTYNGKHQCATQRVF